MEKMKMGILGSGGIAHTMANTVKQMADVELYAVGARTLEKAQSFAEEFGMPKAYGLRRAGSRSGAGSRLCGNTPFSPLSPV